MKVCDASAEVILQHVCTKFIGAMWGKSNIWVLSKTCLDARTVLQAEMLGQPLVKDARTVMTLY